MMRQMLAAACGLWVAGAVPVMADPGGAVVVELYTSQGCSSCPPADDYLARLALNPDVIALALHVDYWDYIGWTDQFGSPQFTERQKAYARAEGHHMIYTPQMIVNGVDRVEGSDPMAVEDGIRRHMGRNRAVTLKLSRDVGTVTIDAAAMQALDGPVTVQLVRYRPRETVAIAYGENAGKTVEYRNIVTQWKVLGHWSGEAPLQLTTPAVGDEPIVVILQETAPGGRGPGEILAASVLK